MIFYMLFHGERFLNGRMFSVKLVNYLRQRIFYQNGRKINQKCKHLIKSLIQNQIWILTANAERKPDSNEAKCGEMIDRSKLFIA